MLMDSAMARRIAPVLAGERESTEASTFFVTDLMLDPD